jgi:hypothetical protein
MKINPQRFFNFCANHAPLLRGLAETKGELSEAEVRRLIRSIGSSNGELPETTWRSLRELQILVPSEAGSDFYFVAPPVNRLIEYLFDEARATTPEIITGYIQSLAALGKQLSRAIEGDDIAIVKIALEEIQQSLRRIQADLDETHRSILTEVARYKTERETISVRDKFRRIVHWMDRYVDPMVEIVSEDGPLRATFDEVGRLLHRAREHGLFNDLPALELNTKHLRLVSRHALRVFQQCRRELQPLYETLRRSSFIAEGAALALERLQREGLDGWIESHVIASCSVRVMDVPGDRAIEKALRDVIENPPEPAPVLVMDTEEATPAGYLRHVWLESLHDEIGESLPLDDLLGWMVTRYPQRDTADTLAGFTRLLFDGNFAAHFTSSEARRYLTHDGELCASPVELTAP